MEALKTKLDDICNAINLDETTKTEAWKKFVAATEQFVIEGDKLSWLVCSLYATCCLEEIETVDGSTTSGSFISLAKMLQVSNISLYNFFSRLHQWCEMVAAPTGFSAHVRRLEQRFIVSSVVFSKYRTVFAYVFDDLDSAAAPSDKTDSASESKDTESCSKTLSPPMKRSRKSKALPCSTNELFEFGWTVFLLVKAQYRQISDNLLNCYHLALSCIDWLYSVAILSSRRDLISSQFRDDLANSSASISANSVAPTKPGSRPPSIIHLLCQRFSGVEVEALAIRQYHWQPALRRFFDSRMLVAGNDNSGIIDSDVFTENKRSVSSGYDEYVLKTGDFDERILMAPDAHARIGSPPRAGLNANNIMSPVPQVASLEASISTTRSNLNKPADNESDVFHRPVVPGSLAAARKLLPLFGRPTPLTARERLGPFVPSTPVGAAATTAACLLQLALSRPPGLSDALSQMLDKSGQKCSAEFDRMAGEYRALLEKALTAATIVSDNESAMTAAQTGLQRVVSMSTSLFFRSAELVLAKERHILALKSGHPDADVSPIAMQPTFVKSLFAVSSEIILSAFCPACAFPWGLTAFSLAPHDLLRVIEPLVRADDHLPRETVKHLNYIEESILECYLWRADSQFWRVIEKAEIPSYEEVCLEKDHQVNQPSSMQSPQNPASTPLRAAMTASSLTPSLSRVLSGTTSTTTSTGFPMSPSSAANNANNSPVPTNSSVCRALFAADDDSKSSDRPQSLRSLSAASPTRATAEAMSPQYVTAKPPAGNKAPPPSAEVAPAPSNRRGGSLALIFRKLYRMLALRLSELCNSLGLGGRFLQLTFTFVEHCLRSEIVILRDRHVDQVVLCAIYMLSKIMQKPLVSFSELLKWYRKLPHANSSTYRSILLHSIESSPEKTENKESVPANPPPSRASTRSAVKRRSVAGKQTEVEATALTTEKPEPMISLTAEISPSSEAAPTADNRGDIVLFYNILFVPKFQDYALELGDGRRTGSVLPNSRFSKLSPLPCRRSTNGAMLSPRHLSSQISIQPLDTSPARFNITSSADRLVVQVNGSPNKDLQAINSALKHRATMSATRRLLGDVDTIHVSAAQSSGTTSSSARQLLDSLGA